MAGNAEVKDLTDMSMGEIFKGTLVPAIEGFIQLVFETGLAEGRRLQALEQAQGRVDE